MTMTRYPEANDNEIWQDDEGTLLTPFVVMPGIYTAWFAFGATDPISESDPKVVHPLTKVAEADGTIVATRLKYPVDGE